MAKYKIGITEAGDAGIDLSWVDKMKDVDGAVLITKCITPEFRNAAVRYQHKAIVHVTCTGYGHSILEPCVPSPYEQFAAASGLMANGFPRERMVIRVDPIIPTTKGIEKALACIKNFMDGGFSRFRISVIDMYPHVRKRFESAGLPLPYGDGFAPSARHLALVDEMLRDAKVYWGEVGQSSNVLRIEACAEPELKECIQCGCISAYDLALFGLDDTNTDTVGYQRRHCTCYSGKTELLSSKHQCPHGCLYCYWR